MPESPGGGRDRRAGGEADRGPHLANPPAAALPDLVSLPSWQISAFHNRRSGRDLLAFNATVWVGGNSPLDVEGFRSDGSPVMKAYQYFWRNGHVVGRAAPGQWDSTPSRDTISGRSRAQRTTRPSSWRATPP